MDIRSTNFIGFSENSYFSWGNSYQKESVPLFPHFHHNLSWPLYYLSCHRCSSTQLCDRRSNSTCSSTRWCRVSARQLAGCRSSHTVDTSLTIIALCLLSSLARCCSLLAVVALCSLSSLFACCRRFFARCCCSSLAVAISSLAVVVLCSLLLFLCSLSFVSSHNLGWPLLLCSFVILLCSLLLDLQIGALASIWSVVLCSFSCFFVLFGIGLWFFAQWHHSLLKVVGRLDHSEQVISLLISSFLVLQLGSWGAPSWPCINLDLKWSYWVW